MAHALVAHYERLTNDVISQLLESEGHEATTATSCWDMLMVMRATLHPLVVVYYDLMLIGPSTEAERQQNDQERVWEVWTRQIDDLRQHRFIENSIHWDQPPEEIRHLYEQLGIMRVPMPFNADELIARFNEAVAQLTPTR